MKTRLRVLIATASVLGAVLIWRLIWAGGPEIDSIDARMEKLRRAGDVEALAALARSEDILAARRATETLGYLGLKAVEHITPLLADPRAEIRQRAATAYARAADPSAAPALAKLARTDDNAMVRAAAVTALGQAQVHGEMDTLLSAMDDDAPIVCARAAEAVTLMLGRRWPYDPDWESPKRQKTIAEIRRFWTVYKDVVARYCDKARRQRKAAAAKSQ